MADIIGTSPVRRAQSSTGSSDEMLEPVRNDGELKALTGVRGIAACLVVAYHFFQNAAMPRALQLLVNHGYIAVDLFFVLSGFVMARTYGPVFRDGFDLRPYLQFLSKRLGRTYPLYIVVMGLTVLQAFSAGKPWTTPQIVDNVLLIQAWGIGDSIVPPSWSISTEFMAYLLFPLLATALLYRRWPVVLGASCVAVAALVLVATRSSEALHQLLPDGGASRNGPLDVFGIGTGYLLLRCLAGFCLGMVGFRAAQRPGVSHLLEGRFVADGLLVLVLALLLVRDSDVILVLLFVPLVIALAAPRSLTSRMMGGGVIYWLGTISYSIYLIQEVVEAAVRPGLGAWFERNHVSHAYTAAGLCSFVMTLMVATVSYYGIEKPGRDWSRRLLSRRPPQPIGSEPSAP